MDLGTTLTGIMCVVICVSPFVLTGISRRKKEKELLTVLKNTAKTNHSEISEYEICGYYAIGIDTTKKTLTFVTKKDEVYQEQFVVLTSLKDCKSTTVKRATKSGKIIQQLYLQLSFAEHAKQDVVLEFYNADISDQLSGEIESLEKWHKTIDNFTMH